MSTPIYRPATPPTFVLSNDGGSSWQARVIPGLPPAQGCTVFADTLQPNTFVISPSTPDNVVFYSTNTGMTWKCLQLPSLTRLVGLTGGQLLAVENRAYGNPGVLLQASLSVGSIRRVAENLPPAGSDPYAAAVDPDDPAVLYISGFSGTTAAVYRTSDAGASWVVAQTLPGAKHIALCTAQQHRVLAEQLDGLQNSHQLLYSADGGNTWNGVTLHIPSGGEPVWLSAQGRVITETGVDSLTYTIYTLDLATGIFATIGTYVVGQGPVLAAVVEGSSPALLYATPDHTWRLPLSK